MPRAQTVSVWSVRKCVHECVAPGPRRLVSSRCETLMSEAGSGPVVRRSSAHTSLSRPPLPPPPSLHPTPPFSRWRAAAGAPLPDNYQPSPQMETSVSPHRSRFLPLPPSEAPLYLDEALPALAMCFVTAD
ncbi:hypothetical protein MHYP_G00137960 [Metynnis hypsauchen]